MSAKRPMEIFYAEDKSADRLLFKLALQDIPISIKLNMAENGEEAMHMLTALDKYLPDIILLDLKMPFKDGNECLAEIRQNKKFDNTPVIIFTTSIHETDIQNAYIRKANLYVQKPFDINMQAIMMREILSMDWKSYFPQPPMDKFVLTMETA